MSILNKYIFALLVIGLISINSSLAKAGEFEKKFYQAVSLYNKQAYDEAERIFSRLPGYQARIGNALSVYMQSKPLQAKFIFLSSVVLADTDFQRHIALYNAASCAFMTGQYSEANKLFRDALIYQKNKNAEHFMLLSSRLNKLLLTELEKNKINRNNKRSGGGKLSISLDEAIFDREASISMEDVSDEKEKKAISYELNSNAIIINKLIENGINAISLTTSSEMKLADQQIAIPVATGQLNGSEYTPLTAADELWRRIFELEYNIPSALDKKENTPGFRRW